MAIDPDIRDQAYQFFVQEAPELLQVIEAGLLKLSQDHSTAKVHDLMRAAHSIKGGAASVGLDAIATLAHRLENIFKALYNQSLEIDTDFENQLLQAYDFLRLPLTEQIILGYFDDEQALAIAEPILTQIEQQFGEDFGQMESYIPNSTELGVDMISAIMEVDVAQALARLAAALAQPQDYEVEAELQTQVEVFAGFAEFLSLPGFGETAETVQRALARRPDRVLEITQLALTDFEHDRKAILSGNPAQAAGPSMALMVLANASDTNASERMDISATDAMDIDDSEGGVESAQMLGNSKTDSLALEDVFGPAVTMTERDFDDHDWATAAAHDIEMTWEPPEPEQRSAIPLDQIEMREESAYHNQALAENITIAAKTIQEQANHAVDETGVGSIEITSEAETDDSDFTTTIDLDFEDAPSTLAEAVQSIEQNFDSLPSIQNLSAKFQPVPEDSTAENPPVNTKVISLASSEQKQDENLPVGPLTRLTPANRDPLQEPINIHQGKEPPIASHLTVRVDAERLEQINNLVGELAINRSGLSLHNDQLQSSLKTLLSRFAQFHHKVNSLRKLSDQMLVAPERSHYGHRCSAEIQHGEGIVKDAESAPAAPSSVSGPAAAEFDPLEMDRYSALDTHLQEILEDMVQLEETVDDINLFARKSDERLEQQQHMLTQLQDDLVWSRMLPLGEVLNRFPRILRNLSTTYHKPVSLNLIGTDVLIDKAVLEKLYTPLLHLLRNAFDHGVESSDIRRQRGKPEQGQIEIRAYHKGNQTIIEVSDDGQGLNLDRIRHRALELGWLSAEQLALTPPNHLLELIFEPGFSTAHQVSKLSGRGVGLDVVRSWLRSIKGSVMVASTPGKGATFTLSVPLTLTIFKLIIVSAGTVAIAMPADGIEEILTPQANQTHMLGTQQFLNWRKQIVPIYQLADLLEYACPLPETLPSKALFTVPSPQDWAPPTLILRQEQQVFALQVDRLITEQELMIKPFGPAIAAPSYAYGCTILGDGSVIPVLDGRALIELELGQVKAEIHFTDSAQPLLPFKNKQLPVSKLPNAAHMPQASTVLVVDDAFTLRQTLTLSLEREGFRVLQARDGREAMDQLQQGIPVQLVICDIEMPNMNGFEFLSFRRQNPHLSKIPVVMLTSRSSIKHRRLAMQLGAAAYFTKPYLEQELLETLENMLN